MKIFPHLAWLAAVAALTFSPPAGAQERAAYEKLVAAHAKANKVPEVLVHRVIARESKYHPELVGHGGTIGLMQIKLATARGLGYGGDAEGLRDPDTNLTYGVKYLAGAWRAAENDHDRAMHYYASGYYHVAKQQRLERLERLKHAHAVLAAAPPKEPPQPKEATAAPKQAVEASAEPDQPEQAEKPGEVVRPKQVVARPKTPANTSASAPAPAKPNGKTKSASKPAPGPLVLTPILAKLRSAFTPSPKVPARKLADARDRVPRPPAGVSGGAHGTKPR